jgi:catechol 2,3-dioxygenase-like lactoylglutathione lyase family enzyme
VTLSVSDLDQSAAFLSAGLGMPASDAALRRPEHEALWGLPGAATRSQVFDAGDVLAEVVQYLDPVGRPRSDAYRISDQGILNVALGTRTKDQFDELHARACAAGARPNSRPLRIPGAGVVYVNDPQQFSVEIVHLSKVSDKHWGFTPIPITRRRQPDTHAFEQTVHIAARPDVIWQVISDHEAMSHWAGIGPVRRIVDGETEPNGRGSQRALNIGGNIIEQVIADNPPDSYRYRIIKGSPFVCHQGELLLRPHGDGTAVTWKIRFRPKIPGTGRLIAAGFSRALKRMMATRLRRAVEHLGQQKDGIS